MYENLVYQCINGTRQPTCGSCPASSARNGPCCFGVRHEYGDSDCSACVLEEQCAPRARANPYHRAGGAPPRPVPPPPQAAPKVTVLPGGQPGGPPRGAEPRVPPDPIKFDPKDPFLLQLLKRAAYGMLWGLFVLGSAFLDRRRPE